MTTLEYKRFWDELDAWHEPGIPPIVVHDNLPDFPKRNACRNAERRAWRVKQAKTQGTHTKQEWKALCRKYGNRCLRCNHKGKLTKDHVYPLSWGGSDSIDNIQPLCRSCNSKNWGMDWRNKCRALVKHCGLCVYGPLEGGWIMLKQIGPRCWP